MTSDRERRTPAWATLEQALVTETRPRPFRAADLAAAAEPVRRYIASAIDEGTALAAGARLRMRGSIKLGRWLRFRAEQLLAPGVGTVWEARVAGVITGSDHYVSGRGAMRWRLLGLVPMVRGEGEDVTRSAAGRVAGESVWVPTALVSRQPPPARPLGDDRIAVDVVVDGESTVVEHGLAEDGRVLWSRFERWGDPDRTGEWRSVPFGLEATAWRSFGGVSIPSAGRTGWHFGTDRWPAGAFFRFEITDYSLVGGRTD